MGTLDTVLMLGLVGVGGYVLWQNWGTVSQGFGGGGGFQQTYAQQPTTYEQPSAQSQPQGDCSGAGTGYCCTDNAGNRCYKGSTSQGVKYVCDEDGNTGCDELRDDFVDRWAVENQPKAPSGKTNPQGAGGCKSGEASCGLCVSQGGVWNRTSRCCNCKGKKISQVKCCATGSVTLKPRAPLSGLPGGPTPKYIPAGQFKYRTNIAGYGDQLAFEELLRGAPGRCQHLVHSPAAYHACVTNQVGAYTYGPNDGTYQNYEELDEYGSYSTYWNRNADVAGRAPMRITFG